MFFTPDCDDCSKNLNAHYFAFTDTNKFGTKSNYVEYIDCFYVVASKIVFTFIQFRYK
jgi:hypothetical protein